MAELKSAVLRGTSLRQWSLAQLKWAFLTLGVVLVGSVLSLTYAMHKRLLVAQRDREEMVALRVFDELEREINAFLETENEREPYQSLGKTNPELWAPFVVGYFKQNTEDEFVAADGATSENRRRMNWALEGLSERLGQPASNVPVQISPQLAPAIQTTPSEGQVAAPRPSKPEAKQAPAPIQDTSSGSKIIDSLNRAPERRKQQATPKSAAPSRKADPFTDYAESF